MRTLMVLLLLMVAGVAQAQKVVKCTQADGSVAYQQTSCGSDAAREVMDVEPTPLINTNEKRFLETFDPHTGQSTGRVWVDVPGTAGGPTYTARELRQINDPRTGQVRSAYVDVQRPVPGYRPPTASRTPPLPPRYNPDRVYNPQSANAPNGSYYQPSDRERRKNSAYEANRCRLLGGC